MVTNSGSTPGDAAIRLDYAEDCYIANNNAVRNGRGIYLYYSHSNIIASNDVSNNWVDGIYQGDGIHFYYSSNNTIANNNICSNSGRGISLHGADSNRIYHNNFMDYTEHPYDEPGDNQWDDGYPSGGNHWSDYTGVDEKSGPNQDLPGSDGIGDTPYDIQGGGDKDRYPLMSPFVPPPSPPLRPQNLDATEGNQQVTLTWSPPAYDGGSLITNYSIYRGTMSGAETFFIEIGNVLT